MTVLGASVEPDPHVIESLTIGSVHPAEYEITNLFGAFTGRAVGTNLSSARIAEPTIAHLEVQHFEVALPDEENPANEATSFRATIGSPSDTAADLDLFVYDCADAGDNPATLAGCTLRGQQADGDSEESVTVNPAFLRPGRWVVVVDGFSVPAGTTTYDYIDVYAEAGLGSITVTDSNQLRPAGATWTVPATIVASDEPGEGRVLYGNVEVRTHTNVLVGRNDVIIENVEP